MHRSKHTQQYVWPHGVTTGLHNVLQHNTQSKSAMSIWAGLIWLKLTLCSTPEKRRKLVGYAFYNLPQLGLEKYIQVPIKIKFITKINCLNYLQTRYLLFIFCTSCCILSNSDLSLVFVLGIVPLADVKFSILRNWWRALCTTWGSSSPQLEFVSSQSLEPIFRDTWIWRRLRRRLDTSRL